MGGRAIADPCGDFWQSKEFRLGAQMSQMIKEIAGNRDVYHLSRKELMGLGHPVNGTL